MFNEALKLLIVKCLPNVISKYRKLSGHETGMGIRDPYEKWMQKWDVYDSKYSSKKTKKIKNVTFIFFGSFVMAYYITYYKLSVSLMEFLWEM